MTFFSIYVCVWESKEIIKKILKEELYLFIKAIVYPDHIITKHYCIKEEQSHNVEFLSTL